jgi:hypothetical protein
MKKSREPIASSPVELPAGVRGVEARRLHRRWEREHQRDKAVFRGIDPKLGMRVKTIAAESGLPAGEVARALIEHALRAYYAGELELDPHPTPLRARKTLFADPDSFHWVDARERSRRSRPSTPAWRVITTWRSFPFELRHELADLACENGLHVPIGELVTVLLRFGLRAYEHGRVTLDVMQMEHRR